MIFYFLNAIIVIYRYQQTLVSFRGVVRFQSNVDEHDPEVCYKNVTAWEKYGACDKLPKFVPFGMNVSLTVGNHYSSSLVWTDNLYPKLDKSKSR